MRNKFQKHLSQNLSFLRNKKLLVTLSGGIDSVVLASLLKDLDYDVTLAHCNFQLRGEESNEDAKFVENFAENNNLKLKLIRFDTASFANDAKVSIQVAARQLRYLWFEEIRVKNELDFIITAHHLDDNLETFLINFCRGTGLDGLTGIPVVNDKIVRPFLEFSREEIENFAIQNNISWREDSSNASNKYQRNKLRHDVIPVLKSLNSSFLNSFQNTLNHLQQAKTMAEDASVILYQQIVIDNEAQKIVRLPELKRLPNYKAYLFQWLQPFGFTSWNDIYDLVEAQSGKFVVSNKFRLLKDRDSLILEPIPDCNTNEYQIIEIGPITTPIRLNLEMVNEVETIHNPKTIFLDYEKLKFPLILRKWKEGDYFCPTGMSGKKKVSKYFKDEKMSLSDKESAWLLESDNQIVWIIGKRHDRRFNIDKSTTQVLKIELL